MKKFDFTGNGSDYFNIWIINVLLTIVTLGFYYPWAKVRSRRYFYANSHFDGRNFEYHATGKQLFLGYVIAMILLILFVTVQKVSLEGSLIIMLISFLVIPWVIWRSLKFNMRMTSFSNVRFAFDGSLGGAYMSFMLFPFLSFLGLYIPLIVLGVVIGVTAGVNMVLLGLILGLLVLILGVWLAIFMFALTKKKQSEYSIGHTRFGQGQFLPQLETKPLMKIYLRTFGISLLAFIIAVIAFVVLAFVFSVPLEDFKSPEDLKGMNVNLSFMVGFAYLILFIVSWFVWAYLYAKQRQYIFANTTLDEKIQFRSTLRARDFAMVVLTNFLLVAITLGLATPWTKVRLARLIWQHTEMDVDTDIDEYITQKVNAQSALGEEIGEVFDVDVGIGF